MTPKNLFFVALTATVSVTACNDKPADKPIKSETAAPESTSLLSKPLSSISGSYTGMFEPNVRMEDNDTTSLTTNKITLVISLMGDGDMKGYSVCAGNQRSLSGRYEEKDGVLKASLQEPGDNKYDGVFEFGIVDGKKLISGTWTPFNKELRGRHYSLERKNFTYDTTQGEYPEASSRLLKAEDVNNLMKDELRYMRNEIYARHGYSFKLKEVRQQFDYRDWYMPVSTDVRKKLTATEIKNEKLIKSFEKYAEESYDDYGR